MFENITASEIAGYSVGALLLSATISASKLDSFVSLSQRSSLGMCKRCGDLKMIACSKCKGSGLIKQRGPFDFITAVGEKQDFDLKATSASSSCMNCRARGHFSCPECSK